MQDLELGKIAEELYNREKSNRDRNILIDKLKSDYKAGNLKMPNPLWRTDKANIDLSLQRDPQHPKLFTKGFTIINDINIEILFDRMTKEDAKMFRTIDLYHEPFRDTSITSILNFWLKNEPLIPPTICIFNKEFARIIDKNIITSRSLRPIDGKHRLHAAYCCSAKSIPIIVPSIQLAAINKRFEY